MSGRRESWAERAERRVREASVTGRFRLEGCSVDQVAHPALLEAPRPGNVSYDDSEERVGEGVHRLVERL